MYSSNCFDVHTRSFFAALMQSYPHLVRDVFFSHTPFLMKHIHTTFIHEFHIYYYRYVFYIIILNSKDLRVVDSILVFHFCTTILVQTLVKTKCVFLRVF